MSNPHIKRTPVIIAAEINAINQECRKMLLKNAIEIGRRLKEAKVLLKHGEWGKWLEESVTYSQRTADRLMQIFEEYWPKFSDGADSSNSSPVTNLTYTQAVLLLGLPDEERKEFVAQHDVGNMTKQELQQTLKDRVQAKQEKDQAPQGNKGTQIKTESRVNMITGSKQPVKASSMPQDLPTHNLKTELDPNAFLKYVERCDACRQIIANTFFDLTTALTNLTYLNQEVKEEKRKEASVLMDALAKTIKEWPPARKPLKVIS